MGFGGQVHHMSDLVLTNHSPDFVPITQVHLFEDVFGVIFNLAEVFEMTGVGETIEINQPNDLGPVYDVVKEI